MINQTNNISAPANETQPRRNWNGWDFFFIIAPIICIILVPLGGLGYIRGRFYPPFYRVDICMLFPLIACFILFCIVCGFVRLFAYGKNHTRKKRFLFAIEVVIPFVFILSCISLFFMPVETFFYPACKPFMYGFRDRVKSKSDISAIRAWLKTLDKEDLDYNRKQPYYFRYHSDELPEFVKAIGGIIGISTDSNGNPVLHCSFGGGFDHWGVEIGAEDMNIPPSDYVSKAGYRMYVEPGFYIVAW
jgi:hypothetical protein